MRFYHGTNKEGLKETEKQGFLLHKREGQSPCTYLAVEKEDAQCYGNIILEVEYDPFKNKKENNYIDGCWQVRVYEPIYNYKICLKNL